MYTLTHKYIHTQRHIQIYTHIHGHTHMHMYIYMHIHMYKPCINEQKKTCINININVVCINFEI